MYGHVGKSRKLELKIDYVVYLFVGMFMHLCAEPDEMKKRDP